MRFHGDAEHEPTAADSLIAARIFPSYNREKIRGTDAGVSGPDGRLGKQAWRREIERATEDKQLGPRASLACDATCLPFFSSYAKALNTHGPITRRGKDALPSRPQNDRQSQAVSPSGSTAEDWNGKLSRR